MLAGVRIAQYACEAAETAAGSQRQGAELHSAAAAGPCSPLRGFCQTAVGPAAAQRGSRGPVQPPPTPPRPSPAGEHEGRQAGGEAGEGEAGTGTPAGRARGRHRGPATSKLKDCPAGITAPGQSQSGLTRQGTVEGRPRGWERLLRPCPTVPAADGGPTHHGPVLVSVGLPRCRF